MAAQSSTALVTAADAAAERAKDASKVESDGGGLTHAQEEQIMKMFALFDTDSSLTISPSELRAVFTALGQTPSESELQSMILKVDTDGKAGISQEEFKELMTNYMVYDIKEKEILAAFETFAPAAEAGETPLLDAAKLRKTLENLDPELKVKKAGACYITSPHKPHPTSTLPSFLPSFLSFSYMITRTY